MHRLVVAPFLVFCLVASVANLAIADHENIPRISSKVMFTGEVVNPSATATSSDKMQAVAASVYQTIQWTATSTGGSPNLALIILGSADDVGFYQPTVGGTVTTITVDGGGIAQIAVPMCQSLKVKLANLSATVTTTMNVTVVSQ